MLNGILSLFSSFVHFILGINTPQSYPPPLSQKEEDILFAEKEKGSQKEERRRARAQKDRQLRSIPQQRLPRTRAGAYQQRGSFSRSSQSHAQGKQGKEKGFKQQEEIER
jgi:hypothetical protein